jgi:UDP-glucose 4-epimerase
VTGGLGYIGSHTVVELLDKRDEKVIIVDNQDNSNVKVLERIKQMTGKDDDYIKYFDLNICDKQAMEQQVFS